MAPEDLDHLVSSMKEVMGPWLQDQIGKGVAEAVAKSAPVAPEAQLPALTIDDIGSRMEEVVRSVVASSRVLAADPAMSPNRVVDTAARENIRELPKISLAHAFEKSLAEMSSPKMEGMEQTGFASPQSGRSLKMSPRVTQISPNEPDQILIPERIVAVEIKNGTIRQPVAADGSPQPPTLLVRKSDRKITVRSMATSIGASTHEEGHEKALVVNFRRLIEIKEKMDIIHEVIKATTIALLTLLAVQSVFHLLYDVVVLVCGIALFSVHEMRHDTMDVDDFKRVVGLLGNDGDDLLHNAHRVGRMENPNRCLQAVSFSRRGVRKVWSYLLVAILSAMTIFAWSLTACTWTLDYDWYSSLGISELPSNEELEHYVTLLLVGTVMLFTHILFELIYVREFGYFLPSKEGRPWDVTGDGMPPGNMNWLFGLPCVWYTTQAAYEDLRVWVTLAADDDHIGGKARRKTSRKQRVVKRVFAEELAFYALEDPACAARLRRCLLTSKLYDKKHKQFMKRTMDYDIAAKSRPSVRLFGLGRQGSKQDLAEFHQVDFSKGEMPSELGIELLFYDNRCSDVWIPKLSDEVDNDAPLRLRHAGSFLQENGFLRDMLH